MIYMYGDSHIRFSFRNLKLDYKDFHQASVTMFRIGRDNIILNFDKNMPLSENDIIVLSYGEIDCRCHIKRQINDGRDEDDIINELIDKYFLTIRNNIVKKCKIIIVGIIPPVNQNEYEALHGPITHEFPFIGKDEDRVRYRNKINKKLEEYSNLNNYIYFNPYAYYTREDGTLKYELSDNIVHLGNNSHFLEKFYDCYKMLNINNVISSTTTLTKFIKESTPCMFTKYGDGEHFAAKFETGANCDGTPYTKNLGEKIIESFRYNTQQTNSMIGIKFWDRARKFFYECLLPPGSLPVPWVEYHTIIIDNDTPIHTQSSEKLELYRAIKESTRRKIYIANSKMFKSKEIFNIDYHIEIHPSNWFDNDFDTVLNSIKEKITDDANTMILFSAGMGAKYLITTLHRLYPNAIYLDIGSAFDTICTGIITRDCYSSYNDMYNYLKPIMPPSLIGNTYTWGAGRLTFIDDKMIMTTWGSGTYKKYDDYIIEASWRGYSHIVVFNVTYTEYISTRKGDLDYTKGSIILRQ